MMDYKEVTKKDGTKIIFCKFEDLLKEAYGVKTIEEVESFANSNGEYICHCPFCKAEGHTKEKLYVKTDLTVGHCFVCGRAYINVTDEVDVSYNVPTFGNLLGHNKFEVIPLSDPTWTLDKFKYEFDDFDQTGYDYLVKRHGFMKDLYKILGFKFWDGNVVMPFTYHGNLIYYQIRFTGNSKIRYFFPPIKNAKPPYIIEHGDNKKFIICEGVYDAIACLIMAPDYTPMAVLGSSISDYQLEFLREYVPESIKIYMDETSISMKILKKLKSVIDYCPVHIIRSDGEDPEECMKRKLKTGGNLQWIK